LGDESIPPFHSLCVTRIRRVLGRRGILGKVPPWSANQERCVWVFGQRIGHPEHLTLDRVADSRVSRLSEPTWHAKQLYGSAVKIFSDQVALLSIVCSVVPESTRSPRSTAAKDRVL